MNNINIFAGFGPCDPGAVQISIIWQIVVYAFLIFFAVGIARKIYLKKKLNEQLGLLLLIFAAIGAAFYIQIVGRFFIVGLCTSDVSLIPVEDIEYSTINISKLIFTFILPAISALVTFTLWKKFEIKKTKRNKKNFTLSLLLLGLILLLIFAWQLLNDFWYMYLIPTLYH